MKYTLNYCKYNPVAILCPTFEIYKKVTRLMKISSILRDYHYKYYKEDCRVSFTYTTSTLQKPYPRDWACFGGISSFRGFETINGEEFLAHNNILSNYEIY